MVMFDIWGDDRAMGFSYFYRGLTWANTITEESSYTSTKCKRVYIIGV